MRHRTSEQCRSEHNTSYRVNALFPLPETCIFIRLPGRGARGRQISPERLDTGKIPFTSARYSFRKTPSSFWRARRSAASRFLAKAAFRKYPYPDGRYSELGPFPTHIRRDMRQPGSQGYPDNVRAQDDRPLRLSCRPPADLHLRTKMCNGFSRKGSSCTFRFCSEKVTRILSPL